MTARRERPGGPGDAPRTDLPPRREPYDDDYFGAGEEEGVVRETEAPERPDPKEEGGERE